MENKFDDYDDPDTSLNQSLIQTNKVHLTLLKYVTISLKASIVKEHTSIYLIVSTCSLMCRPNSFVMGQAYGNSF